ncbi:ABC-type sugar transport system, periplasmic component [Halobacteroides halobius DSM 5150]|uniref:ABC-type sugar transport system, periplasmic component n=1 Tax=Halobacteroides halobius (strain ATCC 35273 / DSM 5150 / MD-1) TaxID=748449 RepID=L0K5H6_HALHC|nr:extracellular solute-binding protein [Halobacteroides halobius]AGB40266.1 ABC-type sugar transport system, periplasmic component [Halobacteroides halobius DSM 5150]
MNNKKIISMALTLVLLAGSLFFVADTSNAWWIFGDDEAKEEKKSGKVTIEVATWADEALKAKGGVIDQFEEKYPNINVKVSKTAFADHHKTLITKIAAGGDVPDVAFIEVSYVGNFAAKGGFVDLSKAPYNADQYKENYVDYAYSHAKTTAGKLIAVPTDTAPATVYYRKDPLNKLGYTRADMQTMQDWIEAGKKFAKDTDGDGSNDRWLIADAANIFNIFARSGENRYFDEEGNCIVTAERFVKGMKIAKKIRDLGLDAGVPAWSGEWVAALKNGTVLMEPTGAWLGGHLKGWIAPKDKGEWRATNLPNGMYAQNGGSFAGIPLDAKHKEAAWKFIKFYSTNTDIQVQNFKVADTFPAWKPAFDHPIMDKPVEYLGGQKARKMWVKAARKIPTVVTNKNDMIAEQIVGNALSAVLENGKDPVKALKDAKKLIERRVR